MIQGKGKSLAEGDRSVERQQYNSFSQELCE